MEEENQEKKEEIYSMYPKIPLWISVILREKKKKKILQINPRTDQRDYLSLFFGISLFGMDYNFFLPCLG